MAIALSGEWYFSVMFSSPYVELASGAISLEHPKSVSQIPSDESRN
jgi:hypothetical protein